MTTNLIKLTDLIQIKPDAELFKLSKTDKHRLMDSVLEHVDSEEKRGLIVHFNLSSSGRRINNRIYTVRGQRDNVSSWLEPYAKPIILHHDKSGETIGRFQNVEWHALDKQAMKFFKDAKSFMRLKDAFERNSPKKIYKELNDNQLLTNRKWPGLGELNATARISDEKAIERFLDGRYLTFSAGSHTDSYTCGVCGSNWAHGDVCEHRPGEITSDGELVVFITGSFLGDEASVVNMPANEYSQVLSMEFGDSADLNTQIPLNCRLSDDTNMFFTDARFSAGDSNMNGVKNQEFDAHKALVGMDALELAKQISSNTLDERIQAVLSADDALSGETHYERTWLIKVHDALHHSYDWDLRYRDLEEQPLPSAVFQLHGRLHQLADEQSFRDSIINGKLDGYDSEGAESEEYMLKQDESMSDSDTSKTTLTDGVDNNTQTDSQDITVEDDSTQTEDQQTEISSDKSVEVNWVLLDMALSAKTGGLSIEERAQLDESVFCGPERMFPLASEDQVEVARELVTSVGLSDEQVGYLSQLIDEKVSLYNSDAAKYEKLHSKYEILVADHAEALKTIEKLEAKINSLDDGLATTPEQHDNIPNEDTTENTSTPSVENPSESSSDSSSPGLQDRTKQSDVSLYEKKILDKYNEILTTDSEEAADRFITNRKARGYISKSFDPKQLMES